MMSPPLATGFWALLFLQLVSGAATSFAWSGVQTLIAQLAEGDARYIGRFSFFARFGSTSAPIVAGAIWDLGGAWPAYLLAAAWAAVLTTALLRAPEAEFFTPQPASGATRNRFRARDAWPRASDYVSAIKLIAIPAVAVSMAVISMRNTTYSLQTSVYVVYLDRIALVGTTIGTLFAAAMLGIRRPTVTCYRASPRRQCADRDACSLPRERVRCVPGMLNSSEVKFLYPT
jgi:MFS family permease